MDTIDWTVYLKHKSSKLTKANLIYTPLISPDRQLLCMDFGNKRIEISNDFYFQRELDYLDRFHNQHWAPEITHIDKVKKKIFFKWYGQTCNDIIYNGYNVDTLKVQECIKDILSAGVYKLNIYPHCFYFDNFDNIHTMDFYACVEMSDPYIPLHQVSSIIGKDTPHRWQEAIEGDRVNFELFFKQTVKKYSGWPGDPLKDILDE